MAKRQWIRMRVGNKSAILRLLDSKIAQVLDIIIEQAHEDGTWISSKSNRNYIELKTDISPPTLFRYIGHLAKKDILLSQTGRGEYKLNRDLIQLAI